MNVTHDGGNGSTELIAFRCKVPQATQVCLIGDFNNWNPRSHPMARQEDGSWRLEVVLHRGRHYYQFLVNSEPMLDPEAMCTIDQIHGSKVSLIALS